MKLWLRRGYKTPWLSLMAALLFSGATPAATDGPAAIDFAHDIAPLIKSRCAECHTNGKYKGSLSLETRESILKAKVVLVGKSAESELIKRITSDDPEMRMPPKGPRLTAAEVGRFKAWVDQGLSWQPGFSFKVTSYVPPLKPRRPSLPPVRMDHDHPLDRLVDAYFAEHHVAGPAGLDDAAFVRRLYLDVVGMLPAAEELTRFSQDTSPGKRKRLIEQVLADKRAYADHWLTFWNDLLRNDYQGTGYIDGGRKQITGWLYQSLLENKPYDQFVRELLSPGPEAEGFINGIKWRGRVNASQVREVQFSQNVSQVFFGINMKCASCHDSFIDTWKLDDAYSLAAVIAEQPLEINRCDKPTGKMAKARFLWPELGKIDGTLPKAKRLHQFVQLVTHPDNGRFARTIVNRLWQRLMGRGLVHPVDVMANKPWNQDLLDYLATYLVDHHYDLKQLIEHIVSSRTYQSQPAVRSQEISGEDYVFRGPEIKRMTAEEYLDAIWMITGTAPTKPAAPLKLTVEASVPGRRFVRAVLVNADGLMRSLGRPNREQVVTTRGDVLTTLQALDLSNGQILTGTLERGATNLLKAMPKTRGDELITDIYIRAFCRIPTSAELATAREILGATATQEGLTDLLWAVFMLPEFQLIR